MIESCEQLEKPGALRRAVAEVGALAAAPAVGVVDRLREMAVPEVLDLLFRLAVETSLRRGPEGSDEVGSPARLLDLAAAGAAAGAVPLWNVVALRDSLVSLEADLHRSGAWDSAEPVWWSPLPPPGRLEAAWREIGERGWLGLSRLADPQGEGAGRITGAGWLARPDLLGPGLRRRIAEELDAAAQLDLKAAGVGGGDLRSSRRSDEVRYVTGLEPDLLDRCPTLAVLAQRLLHEMESVIADLVPEGAAFAPQTAMLARYRAPCDGFAAHLDNPGGSDDNGRTFALVLYLNPPERACSGGALALWAPETSTEEPAAAVLPPAGGSAVLFDARRVPHAVEPLGSGSDRWTLVVWTSDRRRRPPRPLLPVPEPTPATVLGPLDSPPVAPGTVVFRRIGEADGTGLTHGPVIVRSPRAAGAPEPRVGFVTTALAPGPLLDAWCRHHLGLGAAHLLVVLDGDHEGAGEGVPAGDRITVWPRAEAAERWSRLPAAEELDRLRGHAGRGRATWAVAARQALNASAGRVAAAEGELSGEPLDWLVHLDADELFHLEGAGRGGASLGEHFAAVDAAGWRAVRYLNHELLLPWSPGEPARFKRNPAVASARLGPVGWSRLARYLGMEQEGARPYFRAYWNGKGAVSVPAGGWAAGVHGWRSPGAGEGEGSRGETIVAGPSILHYHLPTPAAFRAKYRSAAGGREDAAERPFPPSHLERETAAILREANAAGAGHDEVDARLDRLYAECAVFSPREIELLEAAGLLVTPEIEHPPLPIDGPVVSSSAV